MTAATPHPTPPNWANIPHDILCPLCEYNLRGVQEPRCPECGYRFEWEELLDPSRQRHAYLFEHHATHRIHWFRKTMRGGLRPGRFWRALQPVQLIYPRRLLLYGLLVGLLYVGLIQLIAAAGMVTRIQQTLRMNSQMQAQALSPANAQYVQPQIRKYGSVEKYKAALELQYPTRVTWPVVRSVLSEWPYWLPLWEQPLIALLWPGFSLGALLIFQASMRRARIRTAHVLRCVVYSFDGILWMGLGNVLLTVCGMVFAGGPTRGGLMSGLQVWFNVVMVGYIIYRLIAAYRLYLRFDHPILTVLASQVIAGLAIAKTIALFTIDLRP